jgi:hypothetical protein
MDRLEPEHDRRDDQGRFEDDPLHAL